MQYFRETVGCEVVSIDDESFLADGVKFPLQDILGVKDIRYRTEGNAAQAIVNGTGAVVSAVSHNVLSPAYAFCIFLGVIVILIGLFAPGATLERIIGGLIPIFAIGFVIKLIMSGIGTAHYDAVEAMSTKVYHLLIATSFGEREVLTGKSPDFLERVSQTLRTVINARQGNRDAQECLGRIVNFPRNLIAAEQGNAEAQCAVGYAYLTGEGVKRDLVKAMHFLQMSADHGCAGAQYALGILFADGMPGVTQNYDLALIQLSKVSQNPNATSEQRNEVIRKLETVAEARTKELETKKKNKHRFLILLASSVLFVPLLMALSTIIPGRDPIKIEALQREQAEREMELARPDCIRVGTWEIIGKKMFDTGYAKLIITKSGKNDCEGTIKWDDDNDTERLVGKFDKHTKKLILLGTYIKSKKYGHEYRAYVSGNKLSGGIYKKGSNTQIATWNATWKTEKTDTTEKNDTKASAKNNKK